MRSLTGNPTQAQLKQISPPHLPSLRSRLLPPLPLRILMRSLTGNPTQAQLKQIIASENLTAPFDFPRFLELMKKHLDHEPFDRKLLDAFKVLDKNSTGTDGIDLSVLSSFSSTASDDPPKQVAMAGEVVTCRSPHRRRQARRLSHSRSSLYCRRKPSSDQ